MIKHILKLIWNKKRSNSLMIIEILLAFVVLFFVLAYMFFNIDKTSQPLGFETNDRWMISLDNIDAKDSLDALLTMQNLKRNLLAEEEILGVSFTESISPFSNNQWIDGTDEGGFPMRTRIVPADYEFGELMNINLVEGRWFTEEDNDAVIRPMIVNKNFMDAYYPDKSMIDSIILFHGERKIIGVVDEYRYGGEFEEAINVRFDPEVYTDLTSNAIIKLKPGTTMAYAEKLSNLVNTTTKTTGSIIQSLDKRKKESSEESWLILYALMGVCIFLCLNVALGLFGVLWYNINKRKAEIGLRQALGAGGFDITKQFITEMLILTGFALIIGIFFVIQIPLLDVTEYEDSLFYRAIGYSTFIMIALVMLCALFPAIQAARITPSNSLHED